MDKKLQTALERWQAIQPLLIRYQTRKQHVNET